MHQKRYPEVPKEPLESSADGNSSSSGSTAELNHFFAGDGKVDGGENNKNGSDARRTEEDKESTKNNDEQHRGSRSRGTGYFFSSISPQIGNVYRYFPCCQELSKSERKPNDLGKILYQVE